MPPELAQKLENAWTQATTTRRIGLSDFSHGRKWRDELEESGLMEIVDRDKTAGWLVSQDSLAALMEHVNELEKELEQIQIAALFSIRENRDDWSKGTELADKAKESFLTRKASFKEIVDVD